MSANIRAEYAANIFSPIQPWNCTEIDPEMHNFCSSQRTTSKTSHKFFKSKSASGVRTMMTYWPANSIATDNPRCLWPGRCCLEIYRFNGNTLWDILCVKLNTNKANHTINSLLRTADMSIKNIIILPALPEKHVNTDCQ